MIMHWIFTRAVISGTNIYMYKADHFFPFDRVTPAIISVLLLLRNPYLKISLHMLSNGKLFNKAITRQVYEEMRTKLAALYCLRQVKIGGQCSFLPREVIKKIVNELTELTYLPSYLMTNYVVFTKLLAEKKIDDCMCYVLLEKDMHERNKLYTQIASVALTLENRQEIIKRIEAVLPPGIKLLHLAAYL